MNFDRWLPPAFFEAWMGVLDATFSFYFENQNDKISWKWGSKKAFTTKNVYDHLTSGQARAYFDHIWKAKIPCKIKVFTWLLEKGTILTKDDMVKRKWWVTPLCVFCDQLEMVDHLFFQCSVVRCIRGMAAYWGSHLSFSICCHLLGNLEMQK